jgi:CheY-like chemotaxis protein
MGSLLRLLFQEARICLRFILYTSDTGRPSIVIHSSHEFTAAEQERPKSDGFASRRGAPVYSRAHGRSDTWGRAMSMDSADKDVKGRRVLLVEDNSDTRESLQELISYWGHECEAASNGRDAVNKALALEPDITLIDVGLPGMDGYQVAQKLRQSPWGRDAFLVALTGFGGAEHRSQALDAGFNLHLVKPVDPRKLQKLLEGDLAAVSKASP